MLKLYDLGKKLSQTSKVSFIREFGQLLKTASPEGKRANGTQPSHVTHLMLPTKENDKEAPADKMIPGLDQAHSTGLSIHAENNHVISASMQINKERVQSSKQSAFAGQKKLKGRCTKSKGKQATYTQELQEHPWKRLLYSYTQTMELIESSMQNDIASTDQGCLEHTAIMTLQVGHSQEQRQASTVVCLSRPNNTAHLCN